MSVEGKEKALAVTFEELSQASVERHNSFNS